MCTFFYENKSENKTITLVKSVFNPILTELKSVHYMYIKK